MRQATLARIFVITGLSLALAAGSADAVERSREISARARPLQRGLVSRVAAKARVLPLVVAATVAVSGLTLGACGYNDPFPTQLREVGRMAYHGPPHDEHGAVIAIAPG